jgi:hypothetical protein
VLDNPDFTYIDPRTDEDDPNKVAPETERPDAKIPSRPTENPSVTRTDDPVLIDPLETHFPFTDTD